MKLNKDKGKWFGSRDIDIHLTKEPTILDDIAYHFYCSVRPDERCVPQMTFMWNVETYNHPKMIKYYNRAEVVLKLEKLINKCHEN